MICFYFLKMYFLLSQAGLSIFVSYLRWTRIAYVPQGTVFLVSILLFLDKKVNSRSQSAKCKVQSAKCRVQSAKCEVQSAKC
jgi:hypothetical protein